VIVRGKTAKKYGVNGMKGLIIEMPFMPSGPSWKWVEFGEREFPIPLEEITLEKGE